MIKKIRKIASYRDKIKLDNQDAIEFLKSISKKLPEKTLIYLDPPYYTKGKDLYMNHYKPEDHKEVAIGIKKIKHKWVITYDNVPSIKQLYKGYKKEKYSFRYSAGNTKEGKEVAFFSKGLEYEESVPMLPHH